MSSHTHENANKHLSDTDFQNDNTLQKSVSHKPVYWTTQRIAVYALFTTIAMILSFVEIPLSLGAPYYLKYDPSGVVVLLAGFAYGPLAAVIIAVLSGLPHLFVNPIGGFIAIVCMLSFALPSSCIYTLHRTRIGAVISMIAGAIIFIATALGLNILMTPLYTSVSIQTVLAMIVPILLPFNLIKAVLHLSITIVCYKPITSLLKNFAQSQKAHHRI